MISRRKFIKTAGWGALPVLATLNACETVTGHAGEDDWRADYNIMGDAARFEAGTIVTYQSMLDSGILSDAPPPLLAEMNARLFKSHHDEHLAAFNQAFAAKGLEIVDTGGVTADSRLDDAGNWRDALILALNMEFEAAQFYFSRMTDQLTTTSVRKLFANIFPIEMSHAVAFKFILGEQPAINAGLFEKFSIAVKL
ncbi:MAG TPA: hypothetical protein ENJ10_04725 [Caldithrix abyssi]|uniref:Ferritin-like domain-containing protein n=1 Tax=Caldithrix abyssi TaxID=187145 RepID=A0A7V1LL24_CALAY|nr:hypothetical protein [Caldithrix abyssi]